MDADRREMPCLSAVFRDPILPGVQNQTAITAYMGSKQLLPFGFARQLLSILSSAPGI